MGVIAVISVQRCIFKILIAVFLSREFKHDETNRAWWTVSEVDLACLDTGLKRLVPYRVSGSTVASARTSLASLRENLWSRSSKWVYTLPTSLPVMVSSPSSALLCRSFSDRCVLYRFFS
jgi:hypothetical protein